MNPSKSTPSRRIACLWLVQASLAGAVSLAAVSAPPAQAQPDPPDAVLESARQAQAQGRWDVAFAAYAALADQGHPVAAQEALRLWREGRAGPRAQVADERLARWLRFSACGGHCSAEAVAAAGGC